MSGSVTELVAWRAVQGIGGGIITANAFTIVGDLFAARERGRWQGLIGAVFGLSSVIGPLLGGWLTDGQPFFGLETDWRWTFYINVPIGILAFVFIAIFCPPLKHDTKPKIDIAGATLLTILLGTLILAVDNTATIFADVMTATGLDVVGLRIIMFSMVIAALIGFIMVERRAAQPILPLRFFQNWNYVLLITIAALFGSAFMGSILYLTQFNQQVFGASPTESGLMLLPMVAGIMFTSIGSGQIISRTGRYKGFMQAGLILATISMLLLTTLSPESTYVYEAVIIVALGLGLGVTMPILNLAIQNEFEQRDLGSATSSNQLFRSLGSTIGTAVFGAMLTAGIIANLGVIKDSAYLQQIKDTPQVTMIGSVEDANTLLTLNMPDIKNQITNAVADGPSKEQFLRDQQVFSDKVTHTFSDSLRGIFITATILMGIAATAMMFVKERQLKSARPDPTPGEM
jgi:MFS family permease